MGELSSLRVTVGGAGVFGLAIALELARRGAQVILADPAPEGASASSVAAGMLAPALEAALDPLMHDRFGLLRSARDLWPAFIEDLTGVRLHRQGAVFIAPPAVIARVGARLTAEGAEFVTDEGRLTTGEDWRIEPRPTLAAMRKRFLALGGELRPGPVQKAPAGDVAILACGYQARELAPELAVLSSIRGQLLRFAGGPTDGPILRSPAGYLAPGEGGAVVGATMDVDREDLEPDAAASARLLAAALALAPELEGLAYRAQVGVRAAAPDGLPVVGPSLQADVWVAAGARRNGWLLAPLVAHLVADRLAGREGAKAAAVLDSDRFRPTGGEKREPSRD